MLEQEILVYVCQPHLCMPNCLCQWLPAKDMHEYFGPHPGLYENKNLWHIEKLILILDAIEEHVAWN